MSIDRKLKLALRAKAHHLKPIIIIGNNGLTEAVHLEIERALIDHELIKIKISTANKDEITHQICAKRSADLINNLGSIITIYRKNPDS